MKKTIVHLIATLLVGGAEKQLVYILNALAETESYNLHLIILRNIDDLSTQLDSRVNVHKMGVKSALSFIAWMKLIALLKELSPSVLHSQLYNANIIARLCKLFIPSVRIVNHIHGLGENYSFLRKVTDKSTLRFCDNVITVSKKSASLRINRDGYNPNKIKVLYNFIDVPNIHFEQKREVRETLIIGTAARLIPLKRIDIMMDVVRYINEQGVDCELHIAGKGPHLDFLKKYALQCDISNKVIFKGFVSDLSEYYQNIDVFILNSETEDLPVSIIEAMSFGRAIVATDVGGVSELLEGAVSHMFDLPVDEREMKKILKFCQDNAKINHEANREKVISMYSKEQYLIQLSEFYN